MISKLKALTELLNNAAIEKQSDAWVDLGKLRRAEIDFIYSKTNMDLTDYSHVITSAEVIHILNRHGKYSNDPNPISFDDFLLIPFILQILIQ